MSDHKQRVLYCLTLSLRPDQAKQAGDELNKLAAQPGYVSILLSAMQDPACDAGTKLAASIAFKNHIKQHWEEETQIPPAEKTEVKRLLVPMMLSLPSSVSRQVAESLSLVSQTDFPGNWPTLLPELVAKFAEKDLGVMAGVLGALAQVLKRYRSAFKCDKVLLELKYILDNLCTPILGLFNGMMTFVESGAMQERDALLGLRCLKLIAKIFYCLNCVDLPEFFEDHMAEWMGGFRKTLGWGVAAALPHAAMGTDDGREALLALQAAVCKNANLYAEKYEEEFNSYVEPYLADVWQLLMRVPEDPRFDNLAIAGVRFLTGVTTGVNHKMFGKPEVLQSVCAKIVLPNVRFREADEELFEDSPKEYIRRDIEGSDATTRRRAATELVRGLRKHYESTVTQLFAADVNRMLAEYAANRSGAWQSKDAAIFLVTALAVRGASAAQGATQTNDLVPIPTFFQGFILPDMQLRDTHPVIKADCIKFISTFRKILTAGPAEARTIMNLLIEALNDPNVVVSTYSAAVIERVLVIREDNGAQRFEKDFVAQFNSVLLPALFKLLRTSKEENEFVMKAIMRVFASLREAAAPLAASAIAQLVEIVKIVSANPRNPAFNHYLFETIAALTRSAIQSDAALAAAIEPLLLPMYQSIIVSDVAEFTPYVYQLMALCIDIAPSVSAPYMSVLPSLLTPASWERTGNVPALVRLMTAYLKKAGAQIVSQNHLPALLGVFQRLLAMSATDAEGFRLLNAIIASVDNAAMTPYLPEIIKLVLMRLHHSRTAKLTRCFAVFASHVCARARSASALLATINTIQTGMFGGVVEALWLPGLRQVVTPIEHKICGAGIAAMLFRTPEMLSGDQSLYSAWSKGVAAACVFFAGSNSGPTAQASETQDVYAQEAEDSVIAGVGTTFSQLLFAARPESDPLADLPNDTRALFCTYLHELSKTHPGKLVAVLQGVLQQQYQVLLQWMAQYQIPHPYVL